MERRVVNPWTWQDQFAFVQAHEVSGAQRVVYCAGQISVDDDGAPIHEGDLRAQIGRAFDNLETVLSEAGLDLSNVNSPFLLYPLFVPLLGQQLATVGLQRQRVGLAGASSLVRRVLLTTLLQTTMEQLDVGLGGDGWIQPVVIVGVHNGGGARQTSLGRSHCPP